jgi:putative endonuclease
MWVYVLKSYVIEKKFYIGLTDNVDQRLLTHNAGESFATRKYKPWKVICKVWFERLETAEDFERYLKSGSGRAFSKRHLY